MEATALSAGFRPLLKPEGYRFPRFVGVLYRFGLVVSFYDRELLI